MDKVFGVTQDAVFTIENKQHNVTVSVEYFPKGDIYFVSAETETGFDLTNSSYGYLKYDAKRNTRLRSEQSIANEMIVVLDSYVVAIEKMQADIILTSKIDTVSISGNTACGTSLILFPAANIHSKQSGEVISWYEHDVYNQGKLEVELIRTKEGQLRVYADENKLYDKVELRKLYESKDFQESKFAFFFYNEVRRLLGVKVTGHPKRMSGLMPNDVQE